MSVPFGSLDEPSARPDYGKFLDDVTDLGATDLELVVRWFQVDTKAIEIAPSELDTVDDDLLMWMMDEANTRGLRVSLTPLLEIEAETAGERRGAIAPTDEAWDRWWWSYQRFVTHYARVAGTHKASVLSLGSELVSTEAQADRWRALAKAIRKVYRGKLTYAANIEHIEGIGFWDAFDQVSVTGFRKFVESTERTDEQLRQVLAATASKLRNWGVAAGKRYTFTDLGSLSMAETRPLEDPAVLLGELRRQRVVFEVWQDDPRLDGLFAGAFLTHVPKQPPPHFKKRPAAEVLRYWYRTSQIAAQGSVLN